MTTYDLTLEEINYVLEAVDGLNSSTVFSDIMLDLKKEGLLLIDQEALKVHITVNDDTKPLLLVIDKFLVSMYELELNELSEGLEHTLDSLNTIAKSLIKTVKTLH